MSQEPSRLERLLVEWIRKLKPEIVKEFFDVSNAELELLRGAILNALAFSHIGERLLDTLPHDPERFCVGRILDVEDMRHLSGIVDPRKLPLGPDADRRNREAEANILRLERAYQERAELRADAAIAAWTSNEEALIILLNDQAIKDRIVDILTTQKAPSDTLGPLPREI